MKKVLIVEDSLLQGQVLRTDFENRNFEVMLATNGNESHRALDEKQPDLIILDYVLPDTDGIELCKRIKQNITTRAIPVIMFSSENRINNMVKAYEAGADYYVVKDEDGSKNLALLADSVLTRRYQRLVRATAH
jgi:two-component system, OmpR family, phosphate regulon response regulator PhoB